MLNGIKAIFFDLDETILEFETAQNKAFEIVIREQLPEKLFELDQLRSQYWEANQVLWAQLEAKEKTRDEIRTERWRWTLGPSVPENKIHEISDRYLLHLGKIGIPTRYAADVLESLKDRVQMGVVTNGFQKVATDRIKASGLGHYFFETVSSDRVGSPKPHREIFDYCSSLLSPSLLPEEIAIVGDRLETDILGGNQAGWRTIWLNEKRIAQEEDSPRPHFEIHSLLELKNPK